MVSGGLGLARFEGKVVFVPDVLPGETVLAKVSDNKKGFSKAELVSVIKPSPFRRQPPCPYAGNCGGCDWLHITHPSQIEFKRQIVMENFERIGKKRFPTSPLLLQLNLDTDKDFNFIRVPKTFPV